MQATPNALNQEMFTKISNMNVAQQSYIQGYILEQISQDPELIKSLEPKIQEATRKAEEL